jgi:hypothetical protein
MCGPPDPDEKRAALAGSPNSPNSWSPIKIRKPLKISKSRLCVGSDLPLPRRWPLSCGGCRDERTRKTFDPVACRRHRS